MARDIIVSGKKVILAILAGALFLWLILYLLADKQRQKVKEEAAQSGVGVEYLRPEALEAVWSGLPSEWIRISRVEGQGYVKFIPCDGRERAMALETEAGRAFFSCPACDTDHSSSIIRAFQHGPDSLIAVTGAPAETLKVLPVTGGLLQKFPEAPFQDRLLVWIREGGADSILFTPREYEMEFEELRAEDQSPEGCVETGVLP